MPLSYRIQYSLPMLYIHITNRYLNKFYSLINIYTGVIMTCEYCGELEYGRIIVEKFHWTVYLAPSQRYLGTCVIALNRSCRTLAELEDVEWKEFSDLVREMEFTLDKIFKPTLYNWSCFKNAAFRVENPEPQVHWHLIPRYDKKIEFNGAEFEDPDFGYIPQPIKQEISEEFMEMIKDKIRENFS